MRGPFHLPELAPEGTTCAHHEERPAFCKCPRCETYVCGLCWFGEFDRCHACIVDAPEELAAPLPWEAGEGRVASRLAQTMKSALSPSRSAMAFATGSVSRALGFFLLTFVPLALLRGVIPYTRQLHFGPGLALTFVEGVTPASVALDVARAAGLAFVESAVVFLALVVCYRSLAQAFGRDGSAQIATRALLYRAFLLPLGAFMPLRVDAGVVLLPEGLLLSLGFWLAAPRLELVVVAALLLAVVPALLVFTSMRSVARLVVAASPVVSFLLALVPFVLSVLVFGLVHDALSPFIPPLVFR